MRYAAFENEPDAEATAIVLRENGYNATVLMGDEGGFERRTREFFQGKEQPYETHAVVASDADEDVFARNVVRHKGTVIRGQI
ncbi:MAG: hypothetical protein JO199_02430 [Candidatus Eremiobacteraeota bacterium]|nr:hypothetical protein [Candidatus Eremiobacteraeota bacterium]